MTHLVVFSGSKGRVKHELIQNTILHREKDVGIIFIKEEMFEIFAHHNFALCVLLKDFYNCMITTHLLTRLAWTQGSLTNLSNIICVNTLNLIELTGACKFLGHLPWDGKT